MIPWWAIIIGIAVVVIVVLTVRGWVITRRCRNILKKDSEELPTNHDEDSKSGS